VKANEGRARGGDILTSTAGRDTAHEHPAGLTRRIRREFEDIRYAWGDQAGRMGMLGSALILLGSFGPQTLPNDNLWRDVPVLGWFQTRAGLIAGPGIMFVGVMLLLDAWLRLRPGAPGHRPLTRGTVWLWSLPLLFAPPLLSFDAYSYAAQGELVHRGHDPYREGPGVLGDLFTAQVDNYWRDTPAPYGPLSLQLQHLIVDLTGHNAYLAAILVRIPAFVGVLLLSVYLPRLARITGYDRETTIWLAVLNPLVLLHFVGGAHNDSLMLGLMVFGLWAAASRHLVWGAVVVAAAASIKQPAAAAILAVAALHAWRSKGWVMPTNRELVRPVLAAVGVFVAAFVGISLACGLGFGWITALGVPNTIRSMLSPFTLVGTGVEWVFVQLGLVAENAVVPWFQRIGQVIGLVVTAWLIWRFKARHPVRTLGWILLVLVFTGPVVHPWYVLWGGLFFAMTESGLRARRIAVWATVGLVIYSVVDASTRNYPISVSVGVLASLALVWITSGHDRTLAPNRVPGRRRAERGTSS